MLQTLIQQLGVTLAILLAWLFGVAQIVQSTTFTVKHVNTYPVEGFTAVLAKQIEGNRSLDLNLLIEQQSQTAYYAIHKSSGYVLGVVIGTRRSNGKETWAVLGVNQNHFATSDAAKADLAKYISPDHYWFNPEEGNSMSFLFEDKKYIDCMTGHKHNECLKY